MVSFAISSNISYIVVTECVETPAGINTKPIPAESRILKYLESYSYSCKKGFATQDPLCTFCLPNGTLSKPAPTCQGEVFFLPQFLL